MENTAKTDKPNVIIVDDDPLIGRTISRALADRYNTHILSNGLELDDAMKEFKPDLIILDVGLPWINGYDLCAKLRAQPSYGKIPIVFLSGRQDFVDVMTAMESGATSYLTKPFGIADIERTVDSLLAKKEPVIP
jgi:two-component system aerobic respiration control protein ArcA